MLAAGQIFWESWGGDKVSSVPASGGTQTVWSTAATQWSGPSWAIAPAPDGRGVYWADRSGAVSFASAPEATPQALSRPIPLPDQPLSYFAVFLLADAGRVYLVEYQASYSGSQGSLILPIAR
jgi:hypothetical protein